MISLSVPALKTPLVAFSRNVREKTCLQYLKLYEMARFGASEIDEAMFETFIQVRDELAGALHPAAHPVFQ